jgi:ubiquinone/menaquinone biosynthesis C-methylase UbiE
MTDGTGRLYVHALAGGGFRLRGEALDPRTAVPHATCECTYPLNLIRQIFEAYGAAYTCEEIGREIDDADATLDVKYSIVAYFDDDVFSRPVRILDFGCGSGSSTMALSRLFPNASLVGVDFVSKFLAIGEARAKHYGAKNLTFKQVDSAGVRDSKEEYDLVFLNAVYEHLLPHERPSVLASIWAALKPGGRLILNQTPHRWFPIETHTSGLPLVNYLPDFVARAAIGIFSKRSVAKSNWDSLLRAGVRGASVREIMRNIRRLDPDASLLQPIRLVRAWPEIWYAAKKARLSKHGWLTRGAIGAAGEFIRITKLPISPYVNIAVAKGVAPSKPQLSR